MPTSAFFQRISDLFIVGPEKAEGVLFRRLQYRSPHSSHHIGLGLMARPLRLRSL